jgi:hypothetical protein
MYASPELVKRLDDAVRLDFQSLRDSYFTGLVWFAWIVFLGVLLEGPEVLHELLDRASSFQPKAFSNPLAKMFPAKRFSRLLKWIAVVGWFLVTAGLAGEVAFEVLVSRADGWIQALDETTLKEANDRASRTEVTAAELRKESLILENENLKLRQLVQGRSLTSAQQREIGMALHTFSERALEIEVLSASYDHEAYFFAQGILQAIKYARFKKVLDHLGLFPGFSATYSGVMIAYSKMDLDVARAIEAALIKKGGVPQSGVYLKESNPLVSSEDPRPRAYIAIWVFGKPLPKFP